MSIFTTKVGRTISAIALSLLLLIGVVVYVGWYNLFREVPTQFEAPAEHFKYGSIGTENEEGVPYWIWEVMPRLFPDYLPKSGGYTSLGLTWEEGNETPVGITKKIIGFPRQGITCAVCHNATYRTSPDENPIVVPTGPSTKFDLQSYVRFLGKAGSDPRFTTEYILPAIQYNHDLSLLDRLLYRFVIIPRTKTALVELKDSFTWMDSRPDWGPGRIDPFNPVKFRMLGLPDDGTIGNSDMMPVWNEDEHNGFAYHWDGLETSLTETAQTGALGDGATLKSINLEGIERVEQFMRDFQPPVYPFSIDSALANQGKLVFDSTCASCHAFGGERTGTVIPIDEIGTDRHRLDMWTQAAVDAYSAFSDGYSYDFQELQKTDGYVAVALDGLWLRAPYLHNGSVPYLPDLLETPENRTPQFYRGYDVYDPNKVGFTAEGPEAEDQGVLYDTTVTANSNQGHLYGTDLSVDQKAALVEYLKTL